jgi:hypothetical protein
MTNSALIGPGVSSPPVATGPQRLVRVMAAVAIIGGPLGYLIGGVLEPAGHTDGRATISANALADPTTNATHLVAFVIASLLLPVGTAALAYLAWRRAPWLAVIGGTLGVLGWFPFSALTALDDLAVAMTRAPDNGSFAGLWDVFAFDPVMNSYLIIYIVGHLVAYVLLGIALLRAGVLPRWAATAMIASSPLMIAAWVIPGGLGSVGLGIAAASVGLLIVGSLPAARTVLASPRPGGR